MGLIVDRGDAGPVEVWTVHCPATRNALDYETLDALADACARAAGAPGLRAVVLTGSGNTFVSGGDLRELRYANTAGDGARLVDAGLRVTRGIAELPVPVIAALPGPAVGGGAELALACDLRVAERSAYICFKQARMGVTTAWGTLARITAMVGAARAAHLLFTARDVSADEAFRLGLVDEVCDDGAGPAHAIGLASEIAKGSRDAIAATKAMLRRLEALAPPAFAEEERATFMRLWASHDHASAVDAFFARSSRRHGG